MTTQTLCAILERTDRFIRFAVEDVAVTDTQLRRWSAPEMWAGHIGAEPLMWQGDEDLLYGDGHGLLQAVHNAYATHRPLVLDPDSVWITLAQGVARHVASHAEEMRDAVGADSEGRRVLRKDVDALPRTAEEWTEALDAFGEMLRERHPALLDILVPSFSTSGATARTVGHLTAMSGLRRYYDYQVRSICGIPEVELRGTEEDWRSLRSRLDGLEALAPPDWLDAVKGIADQFLRSRLGDASGEFWSRIYKEKSIYGGQEFTGWVRQLYPYLGDEGTERNVGDWATVRSLPSGVVRAEVLLLGPFGSASCTVLGGVVGAVLDEGRVRPALGWAVAPPSGIAQALSRLDRFRRDEPVPEHLCFSYHPMGPELTELSARAPGLVLQDGADLIRFRPPAEWRSHRASWDEPHPWAPPRRVERSRIAVAEFSGGVLVDHGVGGLLAVSDNGEIRRLEAGWLGLLREIDNSSRVLWFLDNETTSDFEWDPAPEPLPGPRWNGRPEDWRIHRWTAEVSERLHLTFSEVDDRHAALVKELDPTLRHLTVQEVADQLASLGNRVVTVPAPDLDAVVGRVVDLGLDYDVLKNRVTGRAILHVPTGEFPWIGPDYERVVEHMVRSGVQVVRERPERWP